MDSEQLCIISFLGNCEGELKGEDIFKRLNLPANSCGLENLVYSGLVKCKEVPIRGPKQEGPKDKFYSLSGEGEEYYQAVLEFASDLTTEYSNPTHQ